ncbi:UNVERIFIED_CONTAM: hypothetical protein GTU68_020766 [Idotea baltica]|nr:hypothetical protein [Idotea baltica]
METSHVFQDFRAMRAMLVKRWVTCQKVANCLGIG